jgi:hypothetical protein
VSAASVGAVQMKKFQGETLEQLDAYLAALKAQRDQFEKNKPGSRPWRAWKTCASGF